MLVSKTVSPNKGDSKISSGIWNDFERIIKDNKSLLFFILYYKKKPPPRKRESTTTRIYTFAYICEVYTYAYKLVASGVREEKKRTGSNSGLAIPVYCPTRSRLNPQNPKP